MAGGGGGGTIWVWILVIGALMCGVAYGLEHGEVGPSWLVPTLLAVGGLAVIFGSCESMILSVEGVGKMLKWNRFVAGTMAGLASNIPEVVMLAFVVAKEPRVAFVVVMLTIHVGALAFGIYSGMLPRDKQGQARLPKPLVELSTDLYACAAGVFCAMGCLMVVLRSFEAGTAAGSGLVAGDLFVIGGALLFVQVVNVFRLIKRFSAADPADGEAKPEEAKPEEAKPEGDAKPVAEVALAAKAEEAPEEDDEPPPSWGKIIFFGLLGIGTSVIGGHAVGEFAESLVAELTERGHSEMIGAIILSIVACAGVYLMIGTAHMKGKYDIAIANVSGAITQQPFVVLPVILILMAIFAMTGVLTPEQLPAGEGILAIDLETTMVVFFAFPTLLILWKSVQDDGRINWLETASMIALFAMVIFFLGKHG